ncbi:hypothetical protein ACFYWF_01375 [Streptomyces sp. NPDC003344]|uniref:hypothetical protein n=1 Tax=Streptomyces sp. NPDC003344 TaxID=3364682 RepID=UPI0036874BF6
MVRELGLVGLAQSEYLYHFTGRRRSWPHWVPKEIQLMTPMKRLDAILRERQFRAFAPFGAAKEGQGPNGTARVCFSECPPEHFDHLILMRGFMPWAIVTTREHVNRLGGGAVAYVPPQVHEEFVRAGLGHWAVRTEPNSTWLHEREWRVPRPKGRAGLASVTAILIGYADWRPTKVPTGQWVDGLSGEELPGPEAPGAVQLEDYPALWKESPVWVWDSERREVVKYRPGELS